MVATQNLHVPEKLEKVECQPLHQLNIPYEKATFGMGCFWGCDSLFGATKGVLRTRVGYAGGTSDSPVYRNMGDHTELLGVLDLFWNNHEYGLTKRIKRQYMSLILCHNEEQRRISEQSRAEEQIKRAPELIITEIATAGTFYPAEDYHQKYRLQSHRQLAKAIGLTPELLQSSHVAARLNGYLIGVGGVEQFDKDADRLGLSAELSQYVRDYVRDNEGGGIFC
ncbi:peptide methionine sulfoxide reductase msrA [Culex quinquefasciatus]|uniref:peptide-methionine (S)-S-oxide reductase n=1 Tax=Culex quinquefasciatus TaxID=7176 RepID=B0WFN9_CULQU|nr:peptide methionine sulfoxide reductase msrA [Culex quinquefasciatus]|eukprot:XP_001847523.1 peptide methionine sulfoxide reductase msrA [Culex quinquefasciatus]